jgi:hypothetical protein
MNARQLHFIPIEKLIAGLWVFDYKPLQQL